MNKTLKDMLIGVILGDAHIGKTGLDKAFISFEQSKSKINYLNYLHSLTKEGGLPLLDESIKEYSREDTRYNNKTNSLYFRTQSLEVLRPLADQFLNDKGKKIIPTNIAELLTPRSLAFWIMDDGQQVKRGGVTLCTDSFKTDEVKILRDALKTNFNLDTSIHNKKGINEIIYERIYIKKEGLEELKPTLSLHMHESMLYKINENTLIKQDSSEIENVEIDNLDLFDI
jgi:hypothetical protein